MGIRKTLPAWFEPVFYIVILVGSLCLTLNYHSGKGYFNWKSEIWADRAGYYIYLPATLYYHWDLKQAPPKMDERTGYGFYYEENGQKIRTKFTYGVAFLLSPFFVAVHYVTKLAGIPQDWAFAPVYHKMVDIGAVVYLVLGLFFVTRFLKKYTGDLIASLTALVLFTGTNLFYYTVTDSLMSHVYSFFLVALFLFFLKKHLDQPGRMLHWVIVSLAFAFAILIRPTAILLVGVILLLDVRKSTGFVERLKFFFMSKRLPILLLVTFVVWIPQMAYYRYLTVNFIDYSYAGENFPNLLSPRLPELWFSTINGLFTYTPMMFLVVAGTYLMIRRKTANGWMSLIMFFSLSYIFSSWWCWYFGCAFSQRSFTDFLPLLSVPLAYLLEWSGEAVKKYRTVAIGLLILLFSWFNVRLTYAYEECFFGSSWDWNHYGKLLHKAGLWPSEPNFSYSNDYENLSMCNGGKTTPLISRSLDNSLLFDPLHEFNCSFFEYPKNMMNNGKLSRIKLSLYVFKTGSSPTGGVIVCDIRNEGKQLVYESRPLDMPMAEVRKWYKVPVMFDVPAGLYEWSEVRIYIWNKAKTTFYVDDLKIESE